MAQRSLLRSQLARAWRQTIEVAYGEQLINSERGLQVHFCHQLLSQFKVDAVSRRIFVEPCFVDAEGQVRSPDVVICHTRSIIGVVELKYLPRVRPEYEKDLSTLQWFAKSGGEVALSNERYLGVGAQTIKKFSLASDAVLCWAGVYRAPRAEVEAHAESLGRRFYCLHAITSPNEVPVLHPVTEDS